jgi:hypothetical protein
LAGEELYGLGSNDLIGFQNQVAQNDPYGLVGRSLASWQPNTSTWDPGTTMATAFGKSFLSSLLGNYAQQRSADQLNSVIGVLPQLRSDPMSVVAPEGVDASPFAALKGTAILRNTQAQEQEALAQKKFNSDLLARLLGKKADVIGEAQAYQEMGQGGVNPKAPGYQVDQDKMKNLDDLTKQFEAKDEVKEFSKVLSAATAISGALKDKGKVADQELVRYSIQMIEPGMAVREGEQAAVANSQSIPDAWKSQLDSALKGGSALGDDVREGIKRLATRAYESKKPLYEKAVNYYQGKAEGRGLLGPGENISYLGKAPEAVEIFGAAQPAAASLGLPPGLDVNTLASEAAAMKAQNIPAAEIAAALRLKYGAGGSGSIPRTVGGTPLG